MKVHLVDGTYELFRAYYGAPSRTGQDGREVGATRALALSLLSLLRTEGATHVAVAFDHVIESFRNELFDGYKTGAGIDPQLLSQFPLAEETVEALGMVCWPMVEFEADDALAAAAHRFVQLPEVEQIRLCSPDKDLMQCVHGERVVSVDRRRRKVYSEAEVTEKMGVPPRSIPDYLALVGDSADGIPGIPRWGAKSAGSVLSTFRSIENIPHDPAAWPISLRGKATLAASLNESREDAMLYKKLATLRVDVPLEENLNDLEWRGPQVDTIEQISTQLADPGLALQAERTRDERSPE